VLYLLPEIALTTQIIRRLETIFGNDIKIYHSKLNANERVELWQAVYNGKPIVLGARSSLFLPFKNLGLVIVDEEHDVSFKQQDPAPRYNARDAAIYLSQISKVKILLGTATPSVETYFNAQEKKYGFVELHERFSGLELPEIEVADLKKALKQRQLFGNFSAQLLSNIKETLARKEQIILFQNRRGYAPTLECGTCGWVAECKHCDVTLTYHKFKNALNCHYCGYQTIVPQKCTACGAQNMNVKGFGTERIEEELAIHFPEARLGRMDLDTARSRATQGKIIQDFEEFELDILIGTQMVTKGLDFDNVGLVGILSADNLLRYPDFRAAERAFQLMTQVSGRAGRKHKRGKVVLQAFDSQNPVVADVVANNYTHFINRELQERWAFKFPPYFRLIGISLKHKKPEVLNEAVKVFTQILKPQLGERLRGPAVPQVPRVNTYYISNFLVKIERNAERIAQVKAFLQQAALQLVQTEGYSTVRINLDIDPY
jgi:primosomal protein N' (replication factor Y) (superfamily II helicase)